MSVCFSGSLLAYFSSIQRLLFLLFYVVLEYDDDDLAVTLVCVCVCVVY